MELATFAISLPAFSNPLPNHILKKNRDQLIEPIHPRKFIKGNAS
jgi:hypothetical protein